MFLQFFTKRNFTFAKEEVLSLGNGADEDVKSKSVTVGNRGVIELKDKFAKEILGRYPKECEPWGKDAVVKKGPKKAINSRPQGHRQTLDD